MNGERSSGTADAAGPATAAGALPVGVLSITLDSAGDRRVTSNQG
ncbi:MULTISPECIES: hypothetical protein [unclassified Streptomyces]